MDTAISKTGLDYINRSPLDYWWRFLNPDKPIYVKDKKTIFDEAFRMAVTRPDDFSRLYAKQPNVNRTTVYGKTEYSKFMALIEKHGHIPLPVSEYDAIIEMRKSALQHPTLLFSEGYAGDPQRFREIKSDCEVTFCPHWVHLRNGHKLIVNISSCSDASCKGFAKEAFNAKLHKRAAIQMDGFRTGIVFVLVEKEPPYKMQVHAFDDRSIDLGRREYIKNCITYMECLRNDTWPGLPETITPTGLPDWVFKNY